MNEDGNYFKVKVEDRQDKHASILSNDCLLNHVKNAPNVKNNENNPFAYGQPNSPSIRVEAARGEALVGAVEEGEQLLGANHVGHLAPLLMAKVDAFRIRIRTDDNEYRILLECISLDKNIWNGGGYQPFFADICRISGAQNMGFSPSFFK